MTVHVNNNIIGWRTIKETGRNHVLKVYFIPTVSQRLNYGVWTPINFPLVPMMIDHHEFIIRQDNSFSF